MVPGVYVQRAIRYGVAERFESSRLALVAGADELAHGQACPQVPTGLNRLTGDIVAGLEQSEDCLVLSVATPRAARRAPVMVWFHGGGYISGSGEAPKYDPSALAAEGVIVVNVTSRLGVFGYLSPDGFDENLGLGDQILALRWVHDHIAEFGGDPDRVTIFGQSSGGDSVYHLLLAARADGLYRRAIISSAPLGLLGGRLPMTAAMRAAAYDSLTGDPRDVTVEELLTAQRAAIVAASKFGATGQTWPFAPSADGRLVCRPDDIEERLIDVATRVDLLIGHTLDDALPFVPARARNAPLVAKSIGRAATHRAFGEPAQRLVDLWHRAGGTALSYRFDWSPASGSSYGACHFIDVPFLFGPPRAWQDARMLGRGRRADPEIAATMRATWASFARHGADLLGDEPLRFG